MIKAVIFDMFETLVTHYESPVYMAKQISGDIGISESKFREIWDTSDDDRTMGKRSFEDVIEEILRVNNCYSVDLFEKVVAKRKQSKEECYSDHNADNAFERCETNDKEMTAAAQVREADILS